jgi:hypothetical protein
MNLKGYCFFASDCPEKGAPHTAVIISAPDKNKRSLLIPLSSVKFLVTGSYRYNGTRCKYYDAACVFEGDEIGDEKGRLVLNKPSFARYRWAREVDSHEVILKQLSKIYEYRCQVTDVVLQSMQNGAKISKELPSKFHQYFSFF